ncbi:MAG: formylglycine-generating enzyme family protein [Proteobacteria bacterium]|nr:formylglycine-generating enzyme family protein [Pseudomonadota bacterium]
MVWVPGGDFVMGDDVYAEEGPDTPAHVNGFWMDTHEVTNAQFAAFARATGYVTEAERGFAPGRHPELTGDMRKPGAVVFFMPHDVNGTIDIAQWWHFTPGANWRHPAGADNNLDGRENFPVVEITYADAMAYATWKGRALPTEAEWEWAARGGAATAPDHEQPKSANTWQGVFPVLNAKEDGFAGLAPVGCYKPNGYGLTDMIGNVWEWTSDLYAPRHDIAARPEEVRRAIKGGSFLCAPNYCARYRSGAREGQESDLAASHLGFRTILRVKG